MANRPQTRVTLFVPGVPASLSAWASKLPEGWLSIEDRVLRREGTKGAAEAEWVENDGSFGAAFPFGTVTAEMIERLQNAPGALVLESQIDLREGREEILAAVRELQNAGAIAVRVEQSRLGWEISEWLELLGDDSPWSWYRAVVAMLDGDGTLQSCGMHAFSLPDVSVSIEQDHEVLHRLCSTLSVYQLAEDPLLLSGQTFSPDADTPRRVVERWPDKQYPPTDPCHNPYGVWRLGPEGGTARPTGELVRRAEPTPIPLRRSKARGWGGTFLRGLFEHHSKHCRANIDSEVGSKDSLEVVSQLVVARGSV